MAKIFNNTDKKHQQEASLSLSGWEKTAVYDEVRIARISDTIGAGIALAKMGTSIPTPFARIQLFDTAFAQVNSLGHDDTSVYGKLVSECLDFLEFIFNYGHQITIKKWNVNEQIGNLKLSTPKHQKLGSCLEKFALDLNVKDIYLFYYNNVLIGGSSPYTLVYTSPNWQRLKPTTNAKGLAGNVLFDDYASLTVQPTALHRRHITFREYLTKFIIAFHRVGNFNNTQFYKYVYDNQDRYDNEMKLFYQQNTALDAYDVSKFRTDFDVLQVGADIDVLGLGGNDTLYIGCKKQIDPKGVDIVSPDYQIVATSNRFMKHCQKPPLVLNDYGITSAIYVGGQPWAANTLLTRYPNQSMNDRVLPGGGNVKYPYLTDADFLEDKLLQMCYSINQKAFYSFGEDKYLLPLKPAFFNYYNIEDINNVSGLSFTMKEVGDDVEVTLSIPVKCQTHPFIEMKKVYRKNEDIVVVPAIPGFSMAIFPSYQLQNTSIPNIYSVLIHDSRKNGGLSTRFYAIREDGLEQVNETQRMVRTPEGSTYLSVKKAFDVIAVDWDGATAILIPKFKKVEPNAVAQGITVGIDFGTTNSYICLSYNNGANPEPLEITRDDIQVLTLNEVDLSEGNYGDKYKDSFAGMIAFNQAIDREFAPLLLGNQSDVRFPYRTVTCENKAFAGHTKPMLFGNIDLGFNFMKEIVDLSDVLYNTNIKWDIEHSTGNLTDSENRVKAFCQQIAWMVKNKIMLSDNPATNFSVYLTFPYTMSNRKQSDIEDFWEDAFTKMMGAGNVKIKSSYESIAPYYYMIGNGEQFTQNALNVDIGGGTTDMLFADIEKGVFMYNSSLFAGNDIWGDGKQLVMQSRLDNGFVKYFETLLNAGQLSVDQRRKDAYEKYKKLVHTSADLMSYIFRYEEEFRFINYIRNSNKLMPILYTHLGAIVYHIAQVLKEKKMTVPTTITFSGMGAKYILLIAKENVISDLIKKLLAQFMGYGLDDKDNKMPPGFKVSFQASPKEVTAKGAMLEDNSALDDIKKYNKEELCVYGFNGSPKHLEYKDAKIYKTAVLDVFEQFIKDFLENEDIRRYLKKKFEVDFSPAFIDVLRKQAGMGFDLMTKSKSDDEEIEETLFFWPLKNGLYEASKL